MTLTNLCRHTIQADEYQAELEAAEMRSDEWFDNQLSVFEADCNVSPEYAIELLTDALNNSDKQADIADALIAAMSVNDKDAWAGLGKLLTNDATEYFINAED